VFFFKSNWGNLTQKRQNVIINTMPMSINVFKSDRIGEEIEYMVADNDLGFWLLRAKEELARVKKIRAKHKRDLLRPPALFGDD